MVIVDSPSKKMSRYAKPSPVEAVRWTEHRRQLLLMTLQYRVINREIAQLRLYSPGARSQVQRDLTHLWRSGMLSKIPGRAPTECDVYELSRSSPRGLRQTKAMIGRDIVQRVLKRPPAVDHALAVNDLRARMEVSLSRHDFEVQRWLDEFDLNYLAAQGLTPDAFFEVARGDGGSRRRSAFFVEAELAVLSRPHWKRRLAAYHSFYYSGKYTETFDGLRSLRLLVVTNEGGRQAEVILSEAEAVSFTPLRLTTWQAFRLVPAGEVLTAPIWRKPLGEGAASLFEH
jgi:hypothetical protein